MKDLTVGKPLKLILIFSIPILIGNIFNLAYNLADTRIVGSFLGNDALGAIGSISTFNDLLTMFITGVTMGFSVVSSFFFGMNDMKKVKRCFGVSMTFSLGISAAIVTVCYLCMPGILDILNVDVVHRQAAGAYINIILFGIIFVFLYNTLTAVLRSVGDAFTPLIFLIISVCANIGLDLLFVGGFGYGVEGAAWATVISQVMSFVLCFIYMWIKYPMLRLSVSELKPEKDLSSRLLSSGLSMGLMYCLMSIGTLTLQSAINTLGTNTIVAHAATRKITMFYMLPSTTLAAAMATFTGQNYGARKMDRIRTGLKQSLTVSYIWVLVVILISYTICPMLIQAVTGTEIEEVIYLGTLYQKIDTLFYVFVPTISILRNMLQAMEDHITPVVSTGIELIGKLLIAVLLTPLIGYWAIIWSEPIIWVLMVIPLIISSVKRLKKDITTVDIE